MLVPCPGWGYFGAAPARGGAARLAAALSSSFTLLLLIVKLLLEGRLDVLSSLAFPGAAAAA